MDTFSTLNENSKKIIDSHMRACIFVNQFYPLKFLMENLQFEGEIVDVSIFILI